MEATQPGAPSSTTGQEPAPSVHPNRNVVSYGARTVEWVAERHARVLFRHDFLVPPFHCGALTAALEVTCGIPFRAAGRELGFLDSQYDVTW